MKTNPQKGAYPTWSDLLAILGIYLVAMLAFNLGGGLLLRFGIASQGPVVALVYALTFLSTICYALFAKRLRVGPGSMRRRKACGRSSNGSFSTNEKRKSSAPTRTACTAGRWTTRK